MLSGLPDSDQDAIRRLVGKPGKFVGVDAHGFAEIEFAEGNHEFCTIFVNPKVVVLLVL